MSSPSINLIKLGSILKVLITNNETGNKSLRLPLSTINPEGFEYNQADDTINFHLSSDCAFTNVPIANVSFAGSVVTGEADFDTKLGVVFPNAGGSATPTLPTEITYADLVAGLDADTVTDGKYLVTERDGDPIIVVITNGVIDKYAWVPSGTVASGTITVEEQVAASSGQFNIKAGGVNLSANPFSFTDNNSPEVTASQIQGSIDNSDFIATVIGATITVKSLLPGESKNVALTLENVAGDNPVLTLVDLTGGEITYNEPMNYDLDTDILSSIIPSTEPIILSYDDGEPQNLISSNSVVIDQLYLIIGVPYCDLGVLVKGVSNNAFSLSGFGIFLNADYQGVGDYSGVLAFMGFDVTDTHGEWQAGNEGDYNTQGSIVIWDGFNWICNDANSSFDGTFPKDDDSNGYIKLPKEGAGLGYIKEIDLVEYVVSNNWIQRRIDKRGNDVKCSKQIIDNGDLGDNVIDCFQWGNDFVYGNTVDSSRFNCKNNTGEIISNSFSAISDVLANTNHGGIKFNFFVKANIINLNLPAGLNVNGCEIMYKDADFSGISDNINSKKLTPDISTIEAIIDASAGGTLAIPDYVGMVNIFTNAPSNIINNFNSTPSFKRRFFIAPAGLGWQSCSFDDSGNLSFPTPSTGTTLANNNADFIEFLWTGATFIQTASEQY